MRTRPRSHPAKLYVTADQATGLAGAAQVPPAGAFAWRPSSVLVKATEARLDGWQLAGMVQYDAWGQAAFLHRYCRKLVILGELSTGRKSCSPIQLQSSALGAVLTPLAVTNTTTCRLMCQCVVCIQDDEQAEH